MSKRILVFTTAIEHSTFRKTAEMLSKEGADVHVIGFTRDNYPAADSSLSIESLGKIDHGNYMRRFLLLLKFLLFFRKKAKKFDVIYTFTLDTLLISATSLLFKKKTYVYHIQDIRAVFFGKGLKSKLARFLESVLIRKIDLLVVSSVDYFTGYFKKRYGFPKTNTLVIENKLPKVILEGQQNSDPQSEKITIGYFGVMRCERSWQILKSLAESSPEIFDIFLRGKPMAIPGIEDQIRNIHNITYKGLYKSPDDLVELYNCVDMVWAAYPYSDSYDGNWKYARTIRFYEACAFMKPVIVQEGTPQAKVVQKYNIGIVLDMSDITKATSILKRQINDGRLKEWKENLTKVPINLYVHSNEYHELYQTIQLI